jgi:amino acid transporter
VDDATLTELQVRKWHRDIHLKPVLGPVELIFYSVGVIIGAGVYSVLGAAGLAQHGLWISFLVGAGIALLTAISYAEMATYFRPREQNTFTSGGLGPRRTGWPSGAVAGSDKNARTLRKPCASLTVTLGWGARCSIIPLFKVRDQV